MKNAIILHGTCSKEEYYNKSYPTHSNNHWIPWLSKMLLVNDIPVNAIEIPGAFDEQIQDYGLWCKEFERFEISDKTIVVGHSFGGGFILRWLSENKNRILGKVVLVAPWLDPEQIHNDFFIFDFNSTLLDQVNEMIVMSSSDDSSDVDESVKVIAQCIPGITKIEFSDKGHFTKGDLGTEEFPELLQEILR